MSRDGLQRLVIFVVVCCCILTNISYSADNIKKWWPSEWGADDQLGALNRLSPEKVLAAAGPDQGGKDL